jgi:uncharacterized protein YyaL (SSP411 family)
MLANLVRLWLLTGDDAFRRRAEAQRAAFAGELQKNFFPLTSFLNAADLFEREIQVVIAGAPGEKDAETLADAAWSVSQPNLVLQYSEGGRPLPTLHPAYGKGKVAGKAAAYVCRGQTCSLPLTDAGALKAALNEQA